MFSFFKRQRKRIKKIFYVVLFFIIFSGFLGYGYLWYTKPVTSGRIFLPSLFDKVTVYRDKNGVCHIEANNLFDLFKIQGYITAQDRLFQMDLLRRQASGTLSQVIGKSCIERDRFFRVLGLRRAAASSFSKYDPLYKKYLFSYSEGVNAYIKEALKKHKLPLEFKIIGYTPSFWTPIDSLTVGKYMSYDLGGHWKGQAFRYNLLKKFPLEKALDLFPVVPRDIHKIVAELKGSTNATLPKYLLDAVSYHNSLGSSTNGSNNWVISAAKSKSKKPLLANDPHLNLTIPSIWYETHLKAKDFEVSGVTLPGVLGIILGHNKYVAWGATNLGPDVQDLYLEKVNPKNQRQFLYNGKWENAKVVKEVIKVKNSKDVNVEVLITRHGPVFTDYVTKNKGVVFSLRWTALEPSCELKAIIGFAKAKNWLEFEKALTYFHSPAQNFVFASVNGEICFKANGKIPIRKKGNSLLPSLGFTADYDWQGYIPFEKLPKVCNPSNGFIVTANQRIIDDSYPYNISNTWAQHYRAKRITQLLLQKKLFTVWDCQKIQFDCYNLQAEEFVPVFLKYLNKHLKHFSKTEKDAFYLLSKWNFKDELNLGAPLVFHFLMQKIAEVLFEGQLDIQLDKLFEGKKLIVDQCLRRAYKGNPGPFIKEKGGLERVVVLAFRRTVSKIVSLFGSDISTLKWGKYHHLYLKHPLGKIKPLNFLYDIWGYPLSGSNVTVNEAGYEVTTGEVNHGGAFKTVIDMKRPFESYNLVLPGQSEHVLSPFYANQLKAWVSGKYHTTSMKGYENEACLIFTRGK